MCPTAAAQFGDDDNKMVLHAMQPANQEYVCLLFPFHARPKLPFRHPSHPSVTTPSSSSPFISSSSFYGPRSSGIFLHVPVAARLISGGNCFCFPQPPIMRGSDGVFMFVVLCPSESAPPHTRFYGFDSLQRIIYSFIHVCRLMVA